MADQVRSRRRGDPLGGSRHPPDPGDVGAGGSVFAGGTAGNERLTVINGLLLIVLLAALGVTIVFIGRLMWWHLFLGLLLIGPVALKLASTGYRFVRYYTSDPPYTRKGPPAPVLRIMAPAVVALTVIVFVSGVVLLFIGPRSSLRGDAFLLHKVSFIAWVVFTVIHIAGHLPEVAGLPRLAGDPRLRAVSDLSSALTLGSHGQGAQPEPTPHLEIPGRGGRWISVAGAVVLGVVLGVVLSPDFHAWTAGYAALHHHHHHG